MSSRRGWGEDGIFFEHDAPCRDSDRHRHCEGRWRGVISLGFGPDGKRIRRKVSGKTKTVVQDRLKALHGDLESSIRARPNYTVRHAADDWLKEGLDGRSAKTIEKNEHVLAPILATIGARKLRELTAADVHKALTTMARRYSSAAVAIGHNALTRAIRHAEARDLVGRNTGERSSMAFGTSSRRHEDRQVTPDARPPRDSGRCAPGPQETASRGTARRWSWVERSRSRLLHTDR